jgi:hypothetical protein
MDFSSDVLIDFGLNLAGFVIAAVLIYILFGRTRQNMRPPAEDSKKIMEVKKIAGEAKDAVVGSRIDPEFIPLSRRIEGKEIIATSSGASKEDVTRPTSSMTPEVRRKNRRAIYEEARRLLASGKSHGDLLHQLPLTEGELEMLSVAGKA